jgi:hypothetical protein
MDIDSGSRDKSPIRIGQNEGALMKDEISDEFEFVQREF